MTRPTTHLAPAPGFIETPCCDKHPFSLPIGDRIVTVDRRHLVDCGKGEK